MLTIYHNPRCSKSRETLALIESHDIEPSIVPYLDERLSKKTLKSLLSKLEMRPRELLRKNEEAYKALGLSDTQLGDDALISAMIENPKLIERPIVTDGKRAYLGRPPENILPLL